MPSQIVGTDLHPDPLSSLFHDDPRCRITYGKDSIVRLDPLFVDILPQSLGYLLTWNDVDLDRAFVRLPARMTKTKKSRAIPIHPRVLQMLKSLDRSPRTDRVFLKDGKSFLNFKHSYTSACRKAGLTDFTFHDLRHCAINNLRLAGNGYFEWISKRPFRLFLNTFKKGRKMFSFSSKAQHNQSTVGNTNSTAGVCAGIGGGTK